MSAIRTNSVRRSGHDHFEPDVSDDPQVQKRLRAHLEQIDYTAFAANREFLAHVIGPVDTDKVQRLAVAAAHARAAWVKEAFAMSEGATPPTPAQIQRLAAARMAFEELGEAYEGVRRMIERGYLSFQSLTPR